MYCLLATLMSACCPGPQAHKSLPAPNPHPNTCLILTQTQVYFVFFPKLYIQANSSPSCCFVKKDGVLVLPKAADVLSSACCGSLHQWRTQGINENKKLHKKPLSSRAGGLSCETRTGWATDCKPSPLLEESKVKAVMNVEGNSLAHPSVHNDKYIQVSFAWSLQKETSLFSQSQGGNSPFQMMHWRLFQSYLHPGLSD